MPPQPASIALAATHVAEDGPEIGSALSVFLGEVVEVTAESACVATDELGRRMPCSCATLLHPLVVGDQVLVARVAGHEDATVVAILVPLPAAPLADRPLALTSQQRIRLTTGNATLTLTADGLARMVASRIEHDARDAAVIEAGEIRLN